MQHNLPLLTAQSVLSDSLISLPRNVIFYCYAYAGLTNADQRITEDVEKFCFAVADLYSYTFKPLLDVLLFTRSLAKSMGYRTQFALYSYYLLSATVLRALSPPLALMTAQETGLAGAFRSAHQVLSCTSGLSWQDYLAFTAPGRTISLVPCTISFWPFPMSHC